MARRKPVAAVQPGAAAHRSLSAGDLDDLLTRAGVPNQKRAACVDCINLFLGWYDARLAGNNQSNETSQAESLRKVAHAARELVKALASLPPGLLYAVQPDYEAYIRKGFARHVAIMSARAMAAKELAARDPDAQWFADQTASLPRVAREDVKRASPDLLRRGREPLPLEVTLGALIETAEHGRADFERRISRAWSKRRGTLARNELAMNLKATAMVHSPKLAHDQRAAEDWAALVLDTIEIRCPVRETNPGAFGAMFTPAIR